MNNKSLCMDFKPRALFTKSTKAAAIFLLAIVYCVIPFQAEGKEPAIMKYADSLSGKPFSKDPAVVHFGNRYLMYYSSRVNDGWTIGIAESRNLVDWRHIGNILPGG